MFITRKHLSRRTLLKGAGVALGLPFLEAMVPAATALARTAASGALRVGFFYLPHGAILGDTKLGPAWDRWTPSGSGNNFKLNAITQPLEPFRKYVTSIGNLENVAGAGGGSQHFLSPATWLSCTRPAGIGALDESGVALRGQTTAISSTALANPYMAPTLDQIIAASFKGKTHIPSLEVSSETTGTQAAGGNGVPFTTLSFRDATTPIPMEYNPDKVFVQLFGDGKTPQDVVSQFLERRSLLDHIQDQTKELKAQLGKNDKAVLDNYLDSVRTVEEQIQEERRRQALVEKRLADIMVPKRPRGVLDQFDQQVNLMFKLIALAYQADLTRVASYVMVSERSNRTYNHIGVPDSFHPLSHHASLPERMEGLAKIQTWHMSAFAEFLKLMSETPDGDGTLLEHSILLYGSNMANSDTHSSWPLPTVIVGRGNGKIKGGGRHIALSKKTPLANLHLTLLNKIGIEQKKFADSTGVISEL